MKKNKYGWIGLILATLGVVLIAITPQIVGFNKPHKTVGQVVVEKVKKVREAMKDDTKVAEILGAEDPNRGLMLTLDVIGFVLLFGGALLGVFGHTRGEQKVIPYAIWAMVVIGIVIKLALLLAGLIGALAILILVFIIISAGGS